MEQKTKNRLVEDKDTVELVEEGNLGAVVLSVAQY
jgi:hypothetical protein